MFSGLKSDFSYELCTGWLGIFLHQRDDPGAVLDLVARVEFGVVGLLVFNYAEKDFEQSLAQATQSTGMRHAFITLLLVIRLAPSAGMAETVSPQVNSVPHELVTGAPEFGFVELARLVADGRSAGKALEHLGGCVAIGVAADGRQKSRGQHGCGTGQAAEEVMIGMFLEQLLDHESILLQLFMQRSQHLAQRHGEVALGEGDRLGALKRLSLGEERQPVLDSFRAPESMGVEELLPPAATGVCQCLGCGELEDEIPGGRLGPVAERFQSGGIVFRQRLLELIDQQGALGDQSHLVFTEQAQALHQRIHRLEGFPAVSVHAQGIRQTPAIKMVGLGATGHFAQTITLGGSWLNRIDGVTSLKQMINGRPLRGFNGNGQGRIGGHLLTEAFPALRRMFELKIGYDGALRVNDDHRVVISRPVEAAVIHYVFPWFHCFSFHFWHVGAQMRQADTGSLAG